MNTGIAEMAARNYLAIMTRVKAIGLDFGVCQQLAQTFPDPLSVLHALREKGFKTGVLADASQDLYAFANYLGVSSEEILYVSNKQADIESANRVGMVSVLVDFNHENLEYGQQFSISSLGELLQMLD